MFAILDVAAEITSLEITSIEREGQAVRVKMPSIDADIPNVRDYRVTAVVEVSTTLVLSYADETTFPGIDTPQSLIFEFGDGNRVDVRITVPYAQAITYSQGELTLTQFQNTWSVE